MVRVELVRCNSVIELLYRITRSHGHSIVQVIKVSTIMLKQLARSGKYSTKILTVGTVYIMRHIESWRNKH